MSSLFRIEFISPANPKASEELVQGFRKDNERLFDEYQSKYFWRPEI